MSEFNAEFKTENKISNRLDIDNSPTKNNNRDLSLDVFSTEDEEAAKSLGIVLSGSLEDRINRAVVAQNSATALWLETGYLLLKIKSETKQGDFLKHLDAHGICRQRASDLMRTARFYTGLPPEQRRQVFSIGKTKVQLLANADIDVVQDLIDEPGEDLSALSVRQLRQKLRDVTNIFATREKERDSVIDYQKSIINNLSVKKAYTFLPETHITREECLAHQAEIELAFNSLRQLFEGCVNDDNTVERDLRIEQVWVTIHVAAARAMDALAFLRAYNLEGMPETIAIPHRLTDDEALRWIDDYETIERKHIKDQVRRQEKRDTDKPKGPGRPAKGK